MHLYDLQLRMAAQLFKPLHAQLDANGFDYIKSTPTLNAQERIDIYRRSYWSRLIDAFTDDFPGLLALLGEEAFDQLARDYLLQHPSRSFTLRDLGQFLEGWFSKNEPIKSPLHAVCQDMIRLEWAHIEAFDLPEHAALSLEDLAHAGPDTCLMLQPHLQLLTCAYPVDEARLDPSTVENVCAYEGEPIFLAVYRLDLSVHYLRLSHEAFVLLHAIKQGASIDNAIEQLLLIADLSDQQIADAARETFAMGARLGWFYRSSHDQDVEAM